MVFFVFSSPSPRHTQLRSTWFGSPISTPTSPPTHTHHQQRLPFHSFQPRYVSVNLPLCYRTLRLHFRLPLHFNVQSLLSFTSPLFSTWLSLVHHPLHTQSIGSASCRLRYSSVSFLGWPTRASVIWDYTPATTTHHAVFSHGGVGKTPTAKTHNHSQSPTPLCWRCLAYESLSAKVSHPTRLYCLRLPTQHTQPRSPFVQVRRTPLPSSESSQIDCSFTSP